MYLNRSKVGERNQLDSKQRCTSRQPGWTGRPPVMKQRTIMEGSKVPLDGSSYLDAGKEDTDQTCRTHFKNLINELNIFDREEG